MGQKMPDQQPEMDSFPEKVGFVYRDKRNKGGNLPGGFRNSGTITGMAGPKVVPEPAQLFDIPPDSENPLHIPVKKKQNRIAAY
jgi:hypothetical protein